jgi:arylsulfatase A-like enzyme
MIIRQKKGQPGLTAMVAGLAIAASVAPFSGCSGLAKTQEKTQDPVQPNVIFIMTDDHACQAISAYGSTMIDTPNIDRIARGGALFENSFVTNSICAPSRAVILTGKYSHVNGHRDNDDMFDSSQMTYPQLMHDAGYQTALLGKWHLESDPVGFDTYQILTDFTGQGVYYNPNFNEDGQIVRREGYVTDIITEKAIDFLDQATQSDDPFLMLVHHKAPHRNWMPGPEYLGAFEDVEFPVPETFFDDYATRKIAGLADMKIENMYLSQDMKLHKEYYGTETGTGGSTEFAKLVEAIWEGDYNNMTDEQRAAWDAVYDPINKEYAELNLSGDELALWMYQRYMRDSIATIKSVDDSIGEILDYLDEHGLAENTIVIYTSDQGFYLGEHGWYDKRWMYEESFRTPLVMRYPALVSPGTVVDEMVLNLDFAPTILDLARLDVPKEMQGESMRPLITGKSSKVAWRDAIYYHYYEYPNGWHNVRRHFGVRTERYKLINFYNDRYWELFDLENDPNELRNVYDDPACQDVVAELKVKLEELREYYGDYEY